MGEIGEFFAQYAPQYLPIIAAILTIIFTKNYVYRGMVPENMLTQQLEREKAMLQEQNARDMQVLDAAKDLEQNLETIVYQLQNLTKKVSDEIGESNARITGLERFLSDQIDAIRTMTNGIKDLAWQCEKHRKEIPDTEIFRERRE